MASLAVLALVAAPGPVLALCAPPLPAAQAVHEAEIVFVGTVTATAQRNLWATVAVEEVWRGPDLPPVIEVRGGAGGNTGSSIDREYVAGTKYLFVPSAYRDGTMSESRCSSTREWVDSIGGLRPAGARPPIGGAPLPQASDFGGVFIPAGVAILAAGVLLAAWRSGSGRQRG